jgi:subtilisin family serine protease
LATDASLINCDISGNQAGVAGGGIFFGGEGMPYLENCLIADNKAGRDGGGISASVFSQPIISISTIADNLVTGSGYAHGYGGGVSCVSGNYTTIIDSIIWGNRAELGGQVSVGTQFDEGVGSTATISYSSVGPRSTYSNGGSSSGSGSSQGQEGGGTLVVGSDEINSQFDAGAEWVKVIVSLYEPATLRAETNWESPSSVDALRTEIAIRQASVLSTLSSGEFTLRYQYENQAAFSGEVTLEGLDSVISHSLVQYVEPVREVNKLLAQAIPLANAMLPRQVYDGDGVAVAIVDSGVDYTHPMLGGGGFPNAKVIGGYDMGDDDDDPIPFGDAHGTCCAGIAAGSLGSVGDYIGGVAYNAKIYALKVAADGSPGFGNDATLAAWNWCITNQNNDPANPIMVISNSWALWGLPFNDSSVADAFSPAHTVAAQNVANAGITILAGSGNDGFAGSGITWPAAMSNIISVGAVYDETDQVTEYSNTANILDILAPADPVYTTDIVGADGYSLGDYYPNFNGTSSACPFAAGSVAMMQSASMIETGGFLSPDEVRDVLVATGDSVTDTKVAITKPRINLVAAMEIQDSGPIYIEEGSSIEEDGWWDPGDMTWDPESHNLSVDDDPSFVTGPQGNYYLSQIDAGQTEQSPCVDAGSDEAHLLGMYKHTTRTDNGIDEDIIDMGYHYLLSSDITGDFDYNGFVDFCQEVPLGNDLYRFLLHWLDSGCGYPDWCHEKDLNQDGVVNFIDYALASSECGFVETNPPQPDPMTWETPPYAVNSSKISMTATQAVDDHSGFDVWYEFDFVSGPSSGDGRNHALGNKTGWSSVICVTISGGGGGPGAPNPPSSLSAIAISNIQINLQWVQNSDDEDGFKIERSDDGVDFTEIATVGANVTTYNNTGLQPNTTYWYRVRAYNTNGNSAYSNVASATTFPGPPPDTQPPPMPPTVTEQWTTPPTEIIDPLGSGFFVHTMTAATITDATTGGNDPVEYYFQCIDDSSLSSTWQLETTHTSGPVSIYPKPWRWRFKVRDAVGNESEYSFTLQAFPGAGP